MMAIQAEPELTGSRTEIARDVRDHGTGPAFERRLETFGAVHPLSRSVISQCFTAARIAADRRGFEVEGV